MLTLAPLENLTKVDRIGFMICGDSNYFQKWIKSLHKSIQHHAPWAHIHLHIFDPTELDIKWMQSNNCSYTTEQIPKEHLTSDMSRMLYLVAARYMRIREIYTDNTQMINQDADSIMVRDLSRDEFLTSLERSWIPVAPKREQRSLASAIGMGADLARHTICKRYSQVHGTPDWIWTFDQRVLDRMIDADEIGTMDLRYTDFKFTDSSYIWTGKGDRVYKSRFLEQQRRFISNA